MVQVLQAHKINIILIKLTPIIYLLLHASHTKIKIRKFDENLLKNIKFHNVHNSVYVYYLSVRTSCRRKQINPASLFLRYTVGVRRIV